MIDIENYTSKILLRYMKKIEDCQLLLNHAESENRRLRRENASLEDRIDVIVAMKVLNAKVIAYTQAKVDINSIQQELGI